MMGEIIYCGPVSITGAHMMRYQQWVILILTRIGLKKYVCPDRDWPLKEGERSEFCNEVGFFV